MVNVDEVPVATLEIVAVVPEIHVMVVPAGMPEPITNMPTEIPVTLLRPVIWLLPAAVVPVGVKAVGLVPTINVLPPLVVPST